MTTGTLSSTHDLDFGTLLALTRSSGHSVRQIRTQDVMPSSIEGMVMEVLREHGGVLEAGATIGVDEAASRVRILPINP